MRINIKVFPGARKPRIVEEDMLLKVYVNAPAVDGKANAAVVKALSAHFEVRRSAIEIIKGHKSREKMIEVAL